MYSINKSNSFSGISERHISPFVNTSRSACSFCIVNTSYFASIPQRILFCGHIESAKTVKRYSTVTQSNLKEQTHNKRIRLSTFLCVRKSLCRQSRKMLRKIFIELSSSAIFFAYSLTGLPYSRILKYSQSRFRISRFPSKDE